MEFCTGVLSSFMTSLAWSPDFSWKWFLLYKLVAGHVNKVMTSSIISFDQVLSLVQDSV